jgi:tetratricopeptide (TPR) repeat protein
VIELYPEMSGGYNNKALVYKRRGEYAKEEGLYRLALAIDPGDPTALNNLAVCLAHQGRFGEAMRVMDEVERQLPDDAYTWLHRAKILAAKGDDEAALAQLRRALDGIRKLDLMHHIEFRQDLRLDPAFVRLRKDERFFALLEEFYGSSSPVGAGR